MVLFKLAITLNYMEKRTANRRDWNGMKKASNFSMVNKSWLIRMFVWWVTFANADTCILSTHWIWHWHISIIHTNDLIGQLVRVRLLVLPPLYLYITVQPTKIEYCDLIHQYLRVIWIAFSERRKRKRKRIIYYNR